MGDEESERKELKMITRFLSQKTRGRQGHSLKWGAHEE